MAFLRKASALQVAAAVAVARFRQLAWRPVSPAAGLALSELSCRRGHRKLPADWLLPPHQKKDFLEVSEKKTKATLTDVQILQLIDSCKQEHWKWVFRFCAVYGLRPEELFHLQVQTDPETGEDYFWCSYQKKAGDHQTNPRRLFLLPLIDANGVQVNWNLVQLFKAKLVKFEMADRGGALNTYLSRNPLWKQWRAEAKERGEVLKPYALRDSYSLRGHVRGLASSVMSEAMGHSVQCHSSHYVWADKSTTAAAFKRLALEVA